MAQNPGLADKRGKKRRVRKWGQHFLRSSEIAGFIAQTADVHKQDLVIEIGPGRGTLTDALLARTTQIKAIEIDSKLVSFLQEKYSQQPHVEIVHQDVLQFQLAGELKTQPFKVIANIPYHITSPIIFHLLAWHRLNPQFQLAVLMVQREVARRLAAVPGGKDYGVISVNLQMYADVEIVREISPRHFSPPPKVDSAIIRIVFLPEPRIALPDFQLFHAVVKAAFSQRRKTLWNSLQHSLGLPNETLSDIFRITGIDSRRRAETLIIEEFARLAEVFYEKQKGFH